MSATIIDDRVLDCAAEVFGLPAEELSVTTHRDQIASWDSLNHLQFCLRLEAEFGIRLNLDQLTGIDSLARAIDLVHDAA